MSLGASELLADRTSSRVLPVASWVRGAVVAGLIVAVYWGPIRRTLIDRWIVDGNWSHGWLIPIFSVYFLTSRRDALAKCELKPASSGAILLLASLAIYVGGILGFSSYLEFGYLQALTLVGVIGGATLLLSGWEVMRSAWFPIAFLIFCIPLPPSYYVSLTRPLRELASSAAALVLPILVPGLHTQAQAVVIDYLMPGGKTGQLNVEEACSGMRLMMAFVTLGVAMAYYTDRPWWHRAVMLASCIPIAVLCNAVRVTTTGYFVVTGHDALARGTPHQVLGLSMLILAMAMYSLIGYLLNKILVEEEEEISI
ncbi:MAG: exosortase/archaeosortase family protein [Planctomycetes bacterium]|nr:exosortase/archaeosortase family protein [Planctomycetota bacterium]MBI3836165.1 exosortase/archaeosortase family protein [Planctomycetota bacterium]